MHDVVQLAPDGRWGPLLCIVTDVREWGVQCYALIPGEPGPMYLRAELGTFERVGVAVWTIP
jgi:hypothetical protein